MIITRKVKVAVKVAEDAIAVTQSIAAVMRIIRYSNSYIQCSTAERHPFGVLITSKLAARYAQRITESHH